MTQFGWSLEGNRDCRSVNYDMKSGFIVPSPVSGIKKNRPDELQKNILLFQLNEFTARFEHIRRNEVASEYPVLFARTERFD